MTYHTTPAPWHIEHVHWGGQVDRKVVAACGNVVAITPDGISRETAEANARLIAAAPELLAALKRVCNEFDTDYSGGALAGAVAQARVAVEQAEAQP